MKRKMPHRIAVVFLSILIGFLLPCRSAGAQPQKEERDASAIKGALEDMKAGRTYEAIWKLKQLLRRNPNSVEAYHQLGIMYTAKGQYEIALDNVRKAIELDPQSGIYHNQVGFILTRKRRLREALKELQRMRPRRDEPMH